MLLLTELCAITIMINFIVQIPSLWNKLFKEYFKEFFETWLGCSPYQYLWWVQCWHFFDLSDLSLEIKFNWPYISEMFDIDLSMAFQIRSKPSLRMPGSFQSSMGLFSTSISQTFLIDVDPAVTFVNFQSRSVSTYLISTITHLRNAWICSKVYSDVLQLYISDKWYWPILWPFKIG